MKVKLWFLSLQRSIFFKLILIFLATAILLVLLLTLSFTYLSDEENIVHNKIQTNVEQYTNYLLNEIGMPPDYNKADEIADKLGLEIQIKYKNSSWRSTGFNISQDKKLVEHAISGGNWQMGHYRGYSFVTIYRDGYEFLLAVNHNRFSDHRATLFLALVMIIIVVIAFSYFLVRWQFRPVKWISEGVSHVADGDFEFKIPVRKHDELGELSAAFNKMSTEIQAMIKSKEQLLLDVSHELRSPLTRMKLELELMEEGSGRASLQEDIRQMEFMITELLESARLNNAKNTLNKTTFDLVELVNEALTAQNHSIPGIKLISNVKQLMVNADRERLRIVLRNLIDNALKYSSNQTRAIEIDITQTERDIKLSVRDFGEGVPEQDLALIFEPFYRVDKSRNVKTGGYGLGLSLSKRIMQAHGGDLLVKSDPENGTVFTINLVHNTKKLDVL